MTCWQYTEIRKQTKEKLSKNLLILIENREKRRKIDKEKTNLLERREEKKDIQRKKLTCWTTPSTCRARTRS